MKFSRDEKALWVEDWRKSGKKVWTYAKENGLCPQTFAKWVNAQKEAKQNFVEVSAQGIPCLPTTSILIEKGDVKIHIPLGLSSVELRSVMEGLRAVL